MIEKDLYKFIVVTVAASNRMGQADHIWKDLQNIISDELIALNKFNEYTLANVSVAFNIWTNNQKVKNSPFDPCGNKIWKREINKEVKELDES